MKKILSILLTLALFLSLAACTGIEAVDGILADLGLTDAPSQDDNQDDDNQETNGGGQTDESKVTVDSVKLEMSDNSDLPTHVFDGASIRLTAKVKGSQEGLKVDWVSSDESLATVKNGVVKFAAVTEEKEVTISAVSKDDNTKQASHTFTIKHCLLDLANSRGNNLDTSLFMDEGSIFVEAGDVALKFADVYSSKFYVQATIVIDSQNESDAYPKFGIMVGSDSATGWNTTTADTVVKNAFFFGDQQRASQSAGWTSFNFVPQNAEHTDWAWGGQLGGFNVSAENKWSFGEEYTIGLLRDGVDYYLFAKDGEGVKCYKHVVYTDFAADEACYAWIGGWNTGVTVSNLVCLVGDEADAMYAQPTELHVSAENTLLYIGTQQQINVTTGAVNFDLSKVTYESDNESVATVDANGVVTATATPGVANITVKCGDLAETIVITVTDDTKANVVLDGKLDDALWTADVLANKLVFNRPAGDVLIDFYASKNSLGVYIYAYYQTKYNCASAADWWCGNNFEIRVNGVNGKLKNAFQVENYPDNHNQWWVSTANGGTSNFSKHYVSAPKLNEATGMYEIYFEVFMSYASMGITEADKVGFSVGSNDGGGRWYNSANWDTNDFFNSFKVCADGIVTYYPESYCADNHEYNGWKLVAPATCAADGEEVRYCKWCNHKEIKVLPKGEHSFGTEIVEVLTPSTCTVQGEASTYCLGNCGTLGTIKLPLSHTNHSAWDANTNSCSDCGLINHLTDTATLDRYTAGGWDNMDTWLPLVSNIQGGDFSVTVEFEMEINDLNAGWWRGILPVVYDPTVKGANSMVGINGSCWVTRFDWWGWCDQNASSEKLGNYGQGDGAYRNEWTPSFVEDATHCKVVWTCTRTGDVIRNDFAITPLSGSHTDTTYNYWAILTNHNNSTTVSLALSAEFAKAKVTSVVVNY